MFQWRRELALSRWLGSKQYIYWTERRGEPDPPDDLFATDYTYTPLEQRPFLIRGRSQFALSAAAAAAAAVAPPLFYVHRAAPPAAPQFCFQD
ncbi:hypothetical protein JYU34_002417 [Plutella xylostella]|uniref:Uncharacterized protein n=1 Tax=Plutella xylostella TaxID=51655 RepID=A0ABQ7R246_PLUXY|nr:hypothetical protein JYU34_002417 [Plutella xylostella]